MKFTSSDPCENNRRERERNDSKEKYTYERESELKDEFKHERKFFEF